MIAFYSTKDAGKNIELACVNLASSIPIEPLQQRSLIAVRIQMDH